MTAVGERPKAGGSEFSGIVDGAVDHYDAAARLESRGYGDAAARQRGYANVFDHAASIGRVTPALTVDPHRAYHNHRDAAARALLLAATVLMCLPVLPQYSVTSMFVAASAGWLAAQAASAGLYWGLGRRDLARGARLALTCLVPLLAAAAVVALVTGWWEVPVWMIGGFAAAYANTIRASIPQSLVLLLLAAVVALVPITLGRIAASVILVALGLWCLVQLIGLARTGRAPTKSGWTLVGWSLVGALALQAILLRLLLDDPVRFTVIALAGTAAGIFGGPLLEVCFQAIARATRSAATWHSVRRQMFAYGFVAVAGLGILAAAMCLGTAWILHGRLTTPFEWAAAFFVGALSACSGMLMRVGTAQGAAVMLTASAICVWWAEAVLSFQSAAALAVLLGITLVAGLGATHRMARPGWW